jgi:hypothetical protein
MGLRLQLRPGRSLCLSPVWPDESARIVFDRHSGDYWLLLNSSAALVESLQAGPAELPMSEAVAELVLTGLIQPAD